MRKTAFIFAGIMATVIGNAYATDQNTVTSKSYVDAMDATKQNKIPIAGTNTSNAGTSVVTYTDTEGTIGERGFFDYSTSMDGDELVEGHEGDIVTAGDYVSDINGIYNDLDIMGTSITNIRNSINTINTNIDNVNNNINNVAGDLTSQSLESIEIQKLTCANSCTGLSGKELSACEEEAGATGGCTLWTIGNAGTAHKLYSCTAQTVATDCPSCDSGYAALCGSDSFCHCVYGGCNTVNDCPACDSGVKTCTSNRCGCQCKANNTACTSNSECCSNRCATTTEVGVETGAGETKVCQPGVRP